MIGVGFEPTPPKRPVPETGALDRSAIQPCVSDLIDLKSHLLKPYTWKVTQFCDNMS